MDKDIPINAVKEDEAMWSDHNEENPALMPQNIKEEIDDDAMSGNETDPLKIGYREINIAGTSKCYVKEEMCEVKKEDVLLESFKINCNLDIKNIMYSSFTQDDKFAIDVKEHSIEHLVDDSNIAGSSGCDPLCIDFSREEIREAGTKRKCLYKHTETKNRKDDLNGKNACNSQILKKQSKKYNSVECGMIMSSLRNINSHVKSVHKGIKNFKCHDCGDCFARKQQLVIHIKRVHIGIKNLYCEERHKAFFKGKYLKRHINRVHKSIKAYDCSKCEKRFSTMSYLKVHVHVIHNGIKDYNCGICEKRFSAVSHLTL